MKKSMPVTLVIVLYMLCPHKGHSQAVMGFVDPTLDCASDCDPIETVKTLVSDVFTSTRYKIFKKTDIENFKETYSPLPTLLNGFSHVVWCKFKKIGNNTRIEVKVLLVSKVKKKPDLEASSSNIAPAYFTIIFKDDSDFDPKKWADGLAKVLESFSANYKQNEPVTHKIKDQSLFIDIDNQVNGWRTAELRENLANALNKSPKLKSKYYFGFIEQNSQGFNEVLLNEFSNLENNRKQIVIWRIKEPDDSVGCITTNIHPRSPAFQTQYLSLLSEKLNR